MDQKKLKILQQKKNEIDSKIKQIKRQQRAKRNELNNRRKMLIGSYYLEQALRSNSVAELRENMLSFLTKDEDKKLFDEIQINQLIKSR